MRNVNDTFNSITIEIKQMGTPFGTKVQLPIDSTVADAKNAAGISSSADVRYNWELAPDNALLDDWDVLVVQANKYTQW